MKVMITGASGFIGGYLAKYCLRAGCTVFGIDHREPEEELTGADFERCDVRDAKHLSRLASGFGADRIFHLAAQSYPVVSLNRPLETMDSNVGGTINLFECLRASGMRPIVVVACSSAEYGPVASQDLPDQDSHLLHPFNPYGFSKVAQDVLAAQYFSNHSSPSIRIRIFNTTGPGKQGDVCSDLTRRAVEMELGMQPPVMRVGNLTPQRAMLDVRDLVRALWLSAEHGEPGEVYNVSADQIYSVRELIECVRAQSRANFRIEQQPELLRSCDEPVIAGDSSKFRGLCAWIPEIELTRTLRDMMEWWRTQLAASVPTQQSFAASQHQGLRTA